MQTANRLIFDKFNQLEPEQKQQVIELIDHLLQKRTMERTTKEVLLSVSVWTEEDIDSINEVQKGNCAWQIQDW